MVETVVVRTADGAVGDKGRFVSAIEEALLAGDADLAVHSAKDVPGELARGLAIVGVPAREDARDALCGAASLDGLAEGAIVGTTSLRRRSQLLAVRPDLELRELRGNVDTRLARLADGDYDAIVLAFAGLVRLARDSEGEAVDANVMTPAPGQGCLALEARADDDRAAEVSAAVTDPAALACLTVERALVSALDATCDTPVGAYATLSGGTLTVAAYAGAPDGSAWVRDRIEDDGGDPAALGREAAERMLAAGAREILAAAS